MNARVSGRLSQSSHASRTRVERLVERLLLVAIGVSVALMLAGTVLGLAAGDSPSHVLTVSSVPGALVRLEPAAYLSLGLIVLIATPFVRVAGSLAVFALEWDRRYVLVTAAVLAVMCVSVVLGMA